MRQSHVDQGAEVMCMSGSLPTLFRHAQDYRRELTFIPTGVMAEETADDPVLAQAIRAHAQEITGFVRDGMPPMIRRIMGSAMMGPGNDGSLSSTVQLPLYSALDVLSMACKR